MEDSRLKDILYIAPEERVINYKWEKDSENLDPNIAVVSMKDIDQLPKLGYEIKSGSSFYEGMVLCKHPYIQKCYVDANIAETELFRDKVHSIGEVAKYLGVKSISAKAMLINKKKREFNADGEMKYKIVKAELSYRKDENEKYTSTYKIESKYSGKYTTEDYEKAEKLVKQYKMPELKHLLKQRDPKDHNQMIEHTENIELSKELNMLTECAFSLNVMPMFSLSTGLQETLSIEKTVRFEIELKF